MSESLIDRAKALASERDAEIARLEEVITGIRAQRDAEIAKVTAEIKELRSLFPNRRPGQPRTKRSKGNGKPATISASMVRAMALTINERVGDGDKFSVAQVAEWTGRHDTTARNAIGQLTEAGYLRLDQGSRGPGNPALYTVLSRDVIKGWTAEQNGNGHYGS